MSTNDFAVVFEAAARRAEAGARAEANARRRTLEVRRQKEREAQQATLKASPKPRRSVQEVIRAERQRLADAQAHRDAARDRLWGRPAFIVLPREE